MKKLEYFPLGLAKGSAFCNRVAERRALKNNIQAGRHSLIASPRRYGKTSLVLYVLDSLNIVYERLDFFVTTDEKMIEKEFIDKANQLLNKVSSKHEYLFKIIKDQIKKLRLKLIVGSDGVNVELMAIENSDPVRNIRDALLLLDKVLSSKKKQAVLFIDEFQEINGIAKDKGIEGAIRYAAQEASYVNLIFSGSNRYLLGQMFEDRKRPLYKLCERMNIDRIDMKDYMSFIQSCAKKTWKKELNDTILNEIFRLSELHPYYINVLCGRIWINFQDKPPIKSTQIITLWQNYLEEQKSDIAEELSNLSELQKKLLIQIALGNDTQLRSKSNLIKLTASSAAISKSLKVLLNKDYIYQKDKNTFALIDPLIKALINLLSV